MALAHTPHRQQHLPSQRHLRLVLPHPLEDDEVVMTHDERIELGSRVYAEYMLLQDFKRTVTALIALLPIFYGLLTFVFGDALWASSPVYRSALQVPYAPESWGTAFVALGVGLLVSIRKGWHRWAAATSLATALTLAVFMVSFGIEAVRNTTLSALPPAMIYGIFSLLFLARARLSFAVRPHPQTVRACVRGRVRQFRRRTTT